MSDVVDEKFNSQTCNKSVIESKHDVFIAAELMLAKACSSEHPFGDQTDLLEYRLYLIV